MSDQYDRAAQAVMVKYAVRHPAMQGMPAMVPARENLAAVIRAACEPTALAGIRDPEVFVTAAGELRNQLSQKGGPGRMRNLEDEKAIAAFDAARGKPNA